jgi:hypothetical protein
MVADGCRQQPKPVGYDLIGVRPKQRFIWEFYDPQKWLGYLGSAKRVVFSADIVMLQAIGTSIQLSHLVVVAWTSRKILRTRTSHSWRETGCQLDGRSSVASAWITPAALMTRLHMATILKGPCTKLSNSKTWSSSGLTTITLTCRFNRLVIERASRQFRAGTT